MPTNTAPEPAPAPGVHWRAPSIDEASQLAELYDAWAEASGLTWRIPAEEVAHEMASPDADLGADYRIAVDGTGRFVASVAAHLHSVPESKHRAWLFITSRPGFEQLESAAAAWAEARARTAFATAVGDRMPRVVRVDVDVRDTARIARFESLGFTISRYFAEMIRPFAEPIPEVRVPNGVEICDWDVRWVRLSWEAHCEAFADHWGSLPPTFEAWAHRARDPAFRPDLSAVAVAGDAVVGYALSAVYPEDWPHRHRREGWVETLGTRPEWRRRGVASALVIESMRRFAAAGLDHAALGVDSANASGAFGLYERLGFVEVDRTVDLMKELSDTPPA